MTQPPISIAGPSSVLPILISIAALGVAVIAPARHASAQQDIPLEIRSLLFATSGLPEIRPPLETELHRHVPAPLRSWKAMRDAGVVRQLFDYSCGSAALATLLSTPSSPVSEQEILFETLDGLTDEQKSETMELGLSLLDLRQAAERRGLHAAGYRVTPDFLQKLTRPVLVYIEPHGYRHFAVFRGLRGDRVFLADPAHGNIRYPFWRFLEMWQTEGDRGIIFLVDSTPSPLLELSQGPAQPELLGAQQLLNIGPTRAAVVQPARLQ